jgi:hypothetical protein
MSPAASTGHTTINTTPTIIGAVVGGMAVILLATAAVLFLRSCLRARSRDETEDRRCMWTPQVVPDGTDPRTTEQGCVRAQPRRV